MLNAEKYNVHRNLITFTEFYFEIQQGALDHCTEQSDRVGVCFQSSVNDTSVNKVAEGSEFELTCY